MVRFMNRGTLDWERRWRYAKARATSSAGVPTSVSVAVCRAECRCDQRLVDDRRLVLLPPRWQDALFSLHGTFAFALVLASWMYADVPATNVLGVGANSLLKHSTIRSCWVAC